MNVGNIQFLGQIVPSPLNPQAKIKTLARTVPVQLFVASENALKVDATKEAFFNYFPKADSNPQITIKGFNAASGIKEQPVNNDTIQGAQNRITHLKQLAAPHLDDNALHVYVSMENGIFQEQVDDLKNPETFIEDEKRRTVWVDRCVVIVKVAYRGMPNAHGTAISRGVTVPVSAVVESEKSGWNVTCGTFIEKKFGFNSKDWHGQMAGVGRKVLMEEAIATAFENIQ